MGVVLVSTHAYAQRSLAEILFANDSVNSNATQELFIVKPDTSSHHVGSGHKLMSANTNMPSNNIDFQATPNEINCDYDISQSGAVNVNIAIKDFCEDFELSPDIAITYNSGGAGSSYWGGWNITGTSMIHPVNKTYFTDGNSDGYWQKGLDAMALDGERLVFTSYAGQNLVFETQYNHTRVFFNPLSNHYKVFYKDGATANYDLTDGVNYYCTSKTTLDNKNVSYDYISDGGGYSISRINYGEQKSINVSYQSSLGSYKEYLKGHQYTRNIRPSHIKIKKGGIEIINYDIYYKNDSIYSPITSVHMTDGNGGYVNPLQFYYHGDSQSMMMQESSILPELHFLSNDPTTYCISKGKLDYGSDSDGIIIYPNKRTYYIDNGVFKTNYNGNESIVANRNTNQILQCGEQSTGIGFVDAFCMDVDDIHGDEVVRINNNLYNNSDQLDVTIYNFGLNGFREQPELHRTYLYPAVSNGTKKSVCPKYFLTGDFDGNGRCDFLVASITNPFSNSSKNCEIRIYDLYTGTLKKQFSLSGLNISFPNKNSSETDIRNIYNNSDRLIALDVDGDGKLEIGFITANGMIMRKLQYDSSQLDVSIISCSGISRSDLEDYEIYYGEFNGDSYSDILLVPTFGTQKTLKAYFSKGNGTFSTVTTGLSSTKYSRYCLQDINKDGQTDIIEYNNNQHMIKLHTVRDEDFKTNVFTKSYNENCVFVPTKIFSNNDNISFLAIGSSGKIYSFAFSNTKDQTCLLSCLKDSYGNTVCFDYMQLFNSGEYMPNYNNNTFPYVTYSGPMYVCCGINKRSQNSVVSNIRINYANAVLHLQGLGFCGFNSISKTDFITDRFEYSQYDPLNYNVLINNGTNENSVTCAYSTSIDPLKRIWINPVSMTQVDNKTLVEATTTFTTDNYGNITERSTSYPDGSIKRENYSFQNIVNDSIYIIGQHLSKQEKTIIEGIEFKKGEITTYNSQYLPTTITRYSGSESNIENTITLLYDSNMNVVEYKERKYNGPWLITTATYGGTCGKVPLSSTDEYGTITTFSHGTFGISRKTKDGYNTNYTYDNFGNCISVSYPDGKVTGKNYIWDNSHNGSLICVTETNNEKPTKKIYLNAQGQEVCVATQLLDSTFSFVFKEYDAHGYKILESIPTTASGDYSAYTSLYYDDFGRIVEKAGAEVPCEYSYDGLTVTSTEESVDRTIEYGYLGNIVRAQDEGGIITYQYRPDGQPSSVSLNNSITTNFEYDNYGRRTAIIDPSGGRRSKQYDSAGNVSSSTDERGKGYTATYNNYGKITQKVYDDGFYTNYSYDSRGNLLLISDSKGKTKQFTYDSHYRLLTEEVRLDPNGTSFKKRYSYSHGTCIDTIKYYLDDYLLAFEKRVSQNGYLKEILLNGNNSIYRVNNVNMYGMPTSMNMGNIVKEHQYDYQNNLFAIDALYGNQLIQSFEYDISNSTRNIRSIQDNMYFTYENFEYDNLNRLIRYANDSISYDNKGNILSRSVSGNYSYSTPKPYALNALTNYSDTLSTETQHISYNSIQLPDTIIQGNKRLLFDYYGDGAKASFVLSTFKTTPLLPNGAYIFKKSINYYNDQCYEIFKMTGDVITHKFVLFVGGNAYDAPAVLVDDGNSNSLQLYYILRDHLGSITHIVDENGNVIQELSYDAWGNLRNPATHEIYTIDNMPDLFLERGFTGHEHYTEFGLIDMNARLYDPMTCSFLSPDPLLQEPTNTQNYNRYNYCLNNPLRYKDQDGEFILGFIFGFIRGLFTGQNPFKTGWKTGVNECKIWWGLTKTDPKKNFWGRTWELISRFTYQALGTVIGSFYSNSRNYFTEVNDVAYYGGATYIIDFKDPNPIGGVTFGNYINIDTRNERDVVFSDNKFEPYRSPLFMHEYGHYLQSQEYGFRYLFVIGLPSLISAIKDKDNSHTSFWTEVDASARAAKYFNITNWEILYGNEYPLKYRFNSSFNLK